MENVFAYGTLRPSIRPDMIKRFGLTPKGGIATFKGNLKMIDLGSFPGLVRTEGPQRVIIGEVSEVKDLSRLDQYEGYPSLYTREQFDVLLADGSTVSAWIYLFNRKDANADEVVSGDWARRDDTSTMEE